MAGLLKRLYRVSVFLVLPSNKTLSQDELTSGSRDELRKRLSTIVERQRQLIPPLHRDSLVRAPEMTMFLNRLKIT